MSADESHGKEDSSGLVNAGERDASQDVYMACVFQANQLGIAYYDAAQGEMFVLQAHEDGAGPLSHQVLQLAKLQVAPSVIYTSSKSDNNFLEKLRQGVGLDPFQEQFEVRLERASLFSYDRARQCLLQLHIKELPEAARGRDRLHALNTVINLASTQQVCAAGALVAILHREGLLGSCAMDVGEDGVSMNAGQLMTVESLAEISLDGFLVVDPASLQALQIFHEERHPSAMGIGAAKEGFSLFGVLNKCVSGPGRHLLRLWFLRPIINLGVINDRLDAIGFFMYAPEVVKPLRDILRKVKDVPRLLQRLRSLQAMVTAKDLQQLLDSIANLLLLRNAFVQIAADHDHDNASARWPNNTSSGVPSTSFPIGSSRLPAGFFTPPSASRNPALGMPSLPGTGGVPGRGEAGPDNERGRKPLPKIVQKVLGCISEELLASHSLITEVVDFEQAEEGMLITHGISPRLDRMKHDYAGLPGFLTKVVESELARVPRSLGRGLSNQLWSIIYMPQIGFVMRLEGGRLGPELEEYLPDYRFAFEGTGAMAAGAYYTTHRTQELNERFGDMLLKIQDLEASICTELVRRVIRQGTAMGRAVAAAAEVDCLLSLSMAARENGYSRPTLTPDNVLYIQQGRHPLTEMLVETYIPNDTAMDPDRARIQVITGPNVSGKSCYVKQVALIVFMAHIGCYVPAAHATIGLTDRIFTRIASRESLALPQSTFMIDLSQVATMLRLATPRSLCIVDEFGKGTLEADGIGLLCATLGHLSRRPQPPKLLACTHFSEVHNPKYLPRNRQLAFLTMSVLSEPAGGRAAAAAQSRAHGGDAESTHRPGIDKIIFLYRLVPGHVAPSFGLNCARLAGMRQDVLQRAATVMQLRRSGQPVTRLETPTQRERDARNIAIVEALQKLDLKQPGAAEAFLDDVARQTREEHASKSGPSSSRIAA